jgi:glucose-6-phosphate isomerase
MKLLSFSYKKTAGVEQPEINNYKSIIAREITTVANALTTDYQSVYASINLPADTALFSHVQEVVAEKKKLNPSALILIGIGGSNLGTLAVHEAINGKLYNEKSNHLKLYNADTVDATMLNDILTLVEKELQQKKNILINVISKSGSTTETIANFELFLALLK